MLLILLLVGALAAGGFLTKPDEAAHKRNVDAKLMELNGGDPIGAVLDAVGKLAGTQTSAFEDLVVATKYTVRSGDSVVIECLGLYGQFLCSQPEAK
jgi:hypothetical protein